MSFAGYSSAANAGQGAMRVGQQGQYISQLPAPQPQQQWAAPQPAAQPMSSQSFSIPTGAQVTMYPTIAAAQAQLQGCQTPMSDTTVYVPRTTLVKEVRTYQVVSYKQLQSQHPVSTATNVQVVNHPTQIICPEEACAAPVAVAAAPCGPCGAGGVGGAYGAVGPSVITGNMSQTPFRF